MIALNLSIKDEVSHLLQSMAKIDAQRSVEEIDPIALPKGHFDHISKEGLLEMDRLVTIAKLTGLENLKTFDEFKNEL